MQRRLHVPPVACGTCPPGVSTGIRAETPGASGPVSAVRGGQRRGPGGPSLGLGPLPAHRLGLPTPSLGLPHAGRETPGKASAPARPPGADLWALWRGWHHLRGGNQGAGQPAAGRWPRPPHRETGHTQLPQRLSPNSKMELTVDKHRGSPGAVGTRLTVGSYACQRPAPGTWPLGKGCSTPVPPVPFCPLGRM